MSKASHDSAQTSRASISPEYLHQLDRKQCVLEAFLSCKTLRSNPEDWWAMGHQALAMVMEMERLGKQWQLCSSDGVALLFQNCVPRVCAAS